MGHKNIYTFYFAITLPNSDQTEQYFAEI